MRTGKIILNAYILAILAAFFWLPLILLHGYRVWWCATFYVVFAGSIIGGSISRYRIVWRSRKR